MKWLAYCFVFLVGLYVGFGVGKYRNDQFVSSNTSQGVDTIVQVDTISYLSPKEKNRTNVGVKKAVLKIVRDTAFVAKHVADSTCNADSILVEVPIKQKEYIDSNYRVWISGYQTNLDSIYVYQKTKTVVKKVPENKRWGVGVQLGAGYMNGRVTPYVGIGVSYNLISW